MNVIHFLRVVCAGILVVCCFLATLFFKLCINCSGKPLLLAIVHMVFHSCCFACSVMGVDIVYVRRSCMLRVYAVVGD